MVTAHLPHLGFLLVVINSGCNVRVCFTRLACCYLNAHVKFSLRHVSLVFNQVCAHCKLTCSVSRLMLTAAKNIVRKQQELWHHPFFIITSAIY